MEISAEKKARNSWMVSFGDVVTLLITFFVLVMVLHKTEVTKLQRWTDLQIGSAYEVMAQEIDKQGFQVVSLEKTPQGILFEIQSSAAFKSGGYTPSDKLQGELKYLGSLLRDNRLFQVETLPEESKVIDYAKQNGMEWSSEIVIEGHTDNDPILPGSALHNNWFLSAMRSQAVMKTLHQSSDLPAALFSISGFGEYHPIASNATKQGKEMNRRIEILITAGFEKMQQTHPVKSDLLPVAAN